MDAHNFQTMDTGEHVLNKDCRCGPVVGEVPEHMRSKFDGVLYTHRPLGEVRFSGWVELDPDGVVLHPDPKPWPEPVDARG